MARLGGIYRDAFRIFHDREYGQNTGSVPIFTHRASPFGEMARYYAGANALTEAVIALLNDEAIIRYLQE
jgi:hypothetical protein